ncbi:hypothetical protein MNBD_GAMMA06-1690 [hydrothermal vent metagenome]|uniref:Uncharacterized protein n=1 Tax=hydrothermal vent metagenome TaxID=652676 RepID=A0A3B0X405_9ZZZZ
MRYQFIKYNFLLPIIFFTTSVWSDDICAPVTVPVRSETSIAQLLSGLAEDYNFNLSFPKNLDRSMRMDESMELNQLIKMLTKDMNTVLCHEKIDGCNNMRLTELAVMPVGNKTEFINVERDTASVKEYIYIDDMEQYVTDVLMKKNTAKLNEMTPEQAAEFKLLRKRLKEELRDEIAQNREKNKQKKKN